MFLFKYLSIYNIAIYNPVYNIVNLQFEKVQVDEVCFLELKQNFPHLL